MKVLAAYGNIHYATNPSLLARYRPCAICLAQRRSRSDGAFSGAAESDALAERIQAAMEERGWGLWAVEILGGEPFIGFVGLSVPRFEAHFTPCVEIGWRLARSAWGRGYATEAAQAALEFGFCNLGLGEIVSFTAVQNDRSRRVMERLLMTHNPADDFDHPALPAGHRLSRHVLFRLRTANS